ncbi:LIC10362 family protein [Leptospira kmetyi]|uniref:Uncharacterized protein n=1 Tax=Leptospira kmetyi TaxID=408139 RepID=A0A2M9XS46_9LEPT|nr:hypothetical protein [Leptospira kmetyi]AYV56394.1 hypothetical protein EFP84_13310 [Leptospira kmetyi]PJZ28593.1 hypothetical protein CH378_17160 [Leptospira kmetyi]PJZ42152.1 hypothetical protein CH370_07860 [Leptospira kmetyi]TGK10760.1 hypothetical protein EHO62_20055 [Leptospira kmetyi]TGK24988.1 hypothetical protein EHO66_19215 [Leptospira kmetyi]
MFSKNYLMIYALILTILCGLFLILSYKSAAQKENNSVSFRLSFLRSRFQAALHSPFQKESAFLLLSLCAWMLLPLFWGLAFFLKTDANVLIVIGFMIWTYYWLKYLFSTDEAA